MTKQELGNLILSSEDTMYRIGMSLLRNETDVEDALQNAIVKAFEKYVTLRKDEYARTWLIRILINECHNLQRRKKLTAFNGLDVCREEQDAVYEEAVRDYSSLYDALNRLPENQRLILLLFYAEEWSVKEIGQALKLPEGTVKSRLNRARAELRKKLEHMEVCYG